MRDSTGILKRIFDACIGGTSRLMSDNNELQVTTSYIGHHFDTEYFCKNDDTVNRSVLGRIRNAVASAVNSTQKFPKYIILAVDDDIIRCVKFDRQGLSIIFGTCVQWLADEVHALIHEKKDMLLPKEKRAFYPQVFWVLLPYHQNMKNNNVQFKFNQSIEKIVPLYQDMKVLKIRRKWNYGDGSVSPLGVITPDGHLAYWMGIDEAVQFWEVGRQEEPRKSSVFAQPSSRPLSDSSS